MSRILIYLLLFLPFESVNASGIGRIPDLGSSIQVDHYFIGVAPIGGFFISESGERFGVVADEGLFWYNDEFQPSAEEARYLHQHFLALKSNSNLYVPRDTLDIILANLLVIVEKHNEAIQL